MRYGDSCGGRCGSVRGRAGVGWDGALADADGDPRRGIDVDGEGGHRTMVPSELQILVLFHDQGGTHLFTRTSQPGR